MELSQRLIVALTFWRTSGKYTSPRPLPDALRTQSCTRRNQSWRTGRPGQALAVSCNTMCDCLARLERTLTDRALLRGRRKGTGIVRLSFCRQARSPGPDCCQLRRLRTSQAVLSTQTSLNWNAKRTGLGSLISHRRNILEAVSRPALKRKKSPLRAHQRSFLHSHRPLRSSFTNFTDTTPRRATTRTL